MTKHKSIRLYCFTPAVMITTFVIETCAALYTLFRYRANLTARLITATLGSLAFFQLAEYMICEKTYLLSSLDWARLGYVAITILPPLTLHIGLRIAKRQNKPLLMAAYGSAVVFSIFFLFIGHGMQSQQCLGNYVIFSIAPYASFPYGLYYHGWLVTGILLAWHNRHKVKEPNRKKALVWLIFGYLSFMVPAIVVNIIDPATVRAIPSIMCGFAVIMALTLLFKVAPLVLEEKNSDQASSNAY